MERTEVIVKFTPFIFKQSVFIKDISTGKIEEKQIPQKELVSFLSLLPKVEKIHLFGNEAYANKIKEEFFTKYKTKGVIVLINK